MGVVSIPTEDITDWGSFHDVFARVLGFPGFYGRNMDAWIDCLTVPNEMTSTGVEAGETLTLDLGEIDEFRRRCPEQYSAVIECAAFVNARRIDVGEAPILALAFR